MATRRSENGDRDDDDEGEYVLMPVRGPAGTDDGGLGGRARRRGEEEEIIVNNYLGIPQRKHHASDVDRGVSPTIVNIGSRSKSYRRSNSGSSSSSSRSRSYRPRRRRRDRKDRKVEAPGGTTINIGGPPSTAVGSQSHSKTNAPEVSRPGSRQLYSDLDVSQYVREALERDRESRSEDPDKALLITSIGGLHWRIRSLERTASLRYHALDWTVNLLLIAQICLSTVLVASGATGKEYQKGLIIIGVTLALTTGALAVIKTQGTPGRSYQYARGLGRLARRIEDMKTSITSGERVSRDDYEVVQSLYNQIQGDYDESREIQMVEISSAARTMSVQSRKPLSDIVSEAGVHAGGERKHKELSFSPRGDDIIS